MLVNGYAFQEKVVIRSFLIWQICSALSADQLLVIKQFQNGRLAAILNFVIFT